jgi:predicted enzyme related to lactoylglutathione lyase
MLFFLHFFEKGLPSLPSSITSGRRQTFHLAEAAGGKVPQPKQLISDEVGYMGIFLDSEGNRIALHSRK